VQETRGWDETAGTTISQRSKEQAHDYRYFPDPDLTPIEFAPADVTRLRGELGELPQVRFDRYLSKDGMSVEKAQQLIDTPGLADFYDVAVKAGGKPSAVANFLLGDVQRLANETGTALAASALTAHALAELATLTEGGTINSKVAKELLERLWTAGGSPAAIVAAEGLGQVSDLAAIDALVAEVAAANAKTVDEYRAGKTKVMGFLVGQVMKASRGKANPALAEERLRAHLGPAGS
jgi:aspartyl-tRNA(Asn)/glutamyl-tRNA(Gln) amidotransferase subunit B